MVTQYALSRFKMNTLIFTLLNFLLIIVVNGEPIEDFISGNNLFTAAVYKEIAKSSKKNILVSPLSAEIVLALTQSGAKGETGEEIRTSLYLPNTKEATESAIKDLLPKLKGTNISSLHSANKIYVQNGLQIRDQFKEIAKSVYQSEIENIDFGQNQQAADAMNIWVEQHTNNKIRNIIKPSDLDQLTKSVLINALYFQGNWEKPFDSSVTQKQKFYKTSQDTVDVDMIQSFSRLCNYYQNAELDATYLELPFTGQNLSMIFVLPNQKDSISNLEHQIDKVFTRHNFHIADCGLSIPKFKFEDTIDFKFILSNVSVFSLGVKKAFNVNDADFSGISGKKGDLHVNAVKQKSFIAVSETGVEAAAATFGELTYLTTSSIYFIADHPFIFYIKYGKIILFAGKVVDPTSEN